jgi:hypothetical protein
VAGESARAVAQKRREKAARLNRVADAYERGADGEVATAHALAPLPASEWFTLNDVRCPGKRFANIDHVVIGPGGVFVIDSKAWSGDVTLRDGVLRQNGYKRGSTVAAAADAASAVAEQLPSFPPGVVQPVLCFVGEHEIAGRAGDVMLSTTSNVVQALLTRPAVLDPRSVRRTLLALQEALKAARAAPESRSSRRIRPRPPRRAPAKVARKSGAGRPGPRLLGFVLMVGLLFLGVHLLPRLASTFSQVIVSGVPQPRIAGDEHALGTSVRLPGATHRPPLRVTADRAATVHAVGAASRPVAGNRWFAVRLVIHNVGKQAWTSQPGTVAQIVDASDIPHAATGAVQLKEGRVLAGVIHLAPGGVVRGYVVFQRRTVPVTAFILSVGPGTPAEATWSINRQ